jgi:hypothetical protein
VATIIEYSSYAITLTFVIIAIIYWIKNRIRPWRLIGFTYDRTVIAEIGFGVVLLRKFPRCLESANHVGELFSNIDRSGVL